MSRFQKTFTLCTDASSVGLGAVLEQEGHAVAYFSRALRNAESRYSTIELECLAIVESLKRFRHYLIGRHFQILTITNRLNGYLVRRALENCGDGHLSYKSLILR